MYIEVFLLDNAVMTMLVIKTANVILRRRVDKKAAFWLAVLSAVYAACAVSDERLLSVEFKLCLLVLLCFAFAPKTVFELLRAAACLLFATFLLGGITYFVFGTLFAGVLYAKTPLRTAIYAALILWLIVPAVGSLMRKTPAFQYITLTTRYGSANLRARVDTGNTLEGPDGRRVVILKSGEGLIPEGVPPSELTLVTYSTIDSGGVLAAADARLTCGTAHADCLAAVSPQKLTGCDAIMFEI